MTSATCFSHKTFISSYEVFLRDFLQLLHNREHPLLLLRLLLLYYALQCVYSLATQLLLRLSKHPRKFLMAVRINNPLILLVNQGCYKSELLLEKEYFHP